MKKQCTIPFLVLVALIAAIIIGGLTSWVVIRAGSYSKLLSIKDGDFASEVEEISYNQIPMLDEDSAARLGSRKLGELAVSAPPPAVPLSHIYVCRSGV